MNIGLMLRSCLIFVLVLCSIGLVSGALTNGTQAYWTLDNVLTDATGNGNTLTNNGATYTASGKINGAYDFDGVNDYLERTSLINTNNPFTISLWVKPSSASTGGLQDRFISIGANAVGKIRVFQVDGKVRINIIGESFVDSGVVLTGGTWTHLVFRYDGTKFYVDIDDTTTIELDDAGFVSGSTETLRLGLDTSGIGAYDGVIDEVGYWNRSLSQAEVQELYFAQLPGNEEGQYPTFEVDMSEVLQTGNEAYWTLDNVLTDATGNGNTLTNNGATYTADGKINGAYDFDGTNDYLSSSMTITPQSSITFSAWIYWNGKVSEFNCIICNMDGAGSNGYTLFVNTDSTIGFQVAGAGTSVSFASIPTNTWVHIVGTYDGTTNRVYRNGVIQNTATGTATVNAGGNIAIGRAGSFNGRYFDGVIDEASVWNRALSQAEITILYNSNEGLQYPFITTTDLLEIDTILMNGETNFNNTQYNYIDNHEFYVNMSYNFTDISNLYNTTLNFYVDGILENYFSPDEAIPSCTVFPPGGGVVNLPNCITHNSTYGYVNFTHNFSSLGLKNITFELINADISITEILSYNVDFDSGIILDTIEMNGETNFNNTEFDFINNHAFMTNFTFEPATPNNIRYNTTLDFIVNGITEREFYVASSCGVDPNCVVPVGDVVTVNWNYNFASLGQKNLSFSLNNNVLGSIAEQNYNISLDADFQILQVRLNGETNFNNTFQPNLINFEFDMNISPEIDKDLLRITFNNNSRFLCEDPNPFNIRCYTYIGDTIYTQNYRFFDGSIIPTNPITIVSNWQIESISQPILKSDDTIPYTITYDPFPPEITQIGNVSEGTYTVDFSDIFTVTDDYDFTCDLTITDLEPTAPTQDDYSLSCTATQLFASAGRHRAFITATDEAGNTANLTYDFTIKAYNNFQIRDSGNNQLLTDYTMTITSPLGNIVPVDYVNATTFSVSNVNTLNNLELGNYIFEFQKTGFVSQNFSYTMLENSGNQVIEFTTSSIFAPDITQIANVSEGTYTVDFSDIFTVTDDYNFTCDLTITDLEPTAPTQDDYSLSCTATQLFASAGRHRAFITATNLAGNTANLTYDFTIKAYNNFQIRNSANNQLFTDYTMTITSPLGDIVPVDYVNATTFRVSNVNALNNLELGNYTFEFQKQGFVSQNFSYTMLENSGNQVIEYTTSPIAITVNVYNRTDGNLLSGINVSVVLQDITEILTTTGTGLFNTTIPIGLYTAVSVSEDYYTESLTFNYTGFDNVTLNFYMLKSNLSTSSILTVFVSDEFDNIISNADTRLLEYDNSLLAFKQVSQCNTDTNGECEFLIEVGLKAYIVTTSKIIGGSLFTGQTSQSGEIFQIGVSGGQELLGQPITRNIKLQLVDTLQSPSFFGLTLNYPDSEIDTIVSQNETSTLVYVPVSFTANDGFAYNVCLEIYREQGVGQTLLNTTCLESSAGILAIVPYELDRDDSYVFKVTASISGNKMTFMEYNYKSNRSFVEVLIAENLANPMILFFWVLLLGTALYLRNISAWVYGAWGLSVLQVFIFPTLLFASTMVMIILINAGVLYLGRRTEDRL